MIAVTTAMRFIDGIAIYYPIKSSFAFGMRYAIAIIPTAMSAVMILDLFIVLSQVGRLGVTANPWPHSSKANTLGPEKQAFFGRAMALLGYVLPPL